MRFLGIRDKQTGYMVKVIWNIGVMERWRNGIWELNSNITLAIQSYNLFLIFFFDILNQKTIFDVITQ